MSQVHYEFIDIETMIYRSPCIILARRDEPFISIEKIDPGPPFKELENTDISPYEKRVYSFIVTKVLRDTKSRIERAPVKVLEAHFESSLKVYRDWVRKGLMRSPCYEAYNASGNLNDLEEMILFLNYNDDENVPCRFAFDFSWESVDRLKTVRKIIRKQQKGFLSFLRFSRR